MAGDAKGSPRALLSGVRISSGALLDTAFLLGEAVLSKIPAVLWGPDSPESSS